MLNGTTTASTTTDAGGNYAFRDLRKGGSYDVTPTVGSMKFNPPGYSFRLMRDETADFSGVVERELEVVCTGDDKDREGRAIIDRFGAAWRRRIQSAPPKVRAGGMPGGMHGEQRATLGRIEYQSMFLRNCTAAVFTARYVWEVTSHAGTERVPGEKRFTCVKPGGIWLCN